MSGIFIKNEKGNFECPSKFIVKDIVRWGPWHGTHTFCGTVWELLLAGFCCMLMLGCGSSGVVSPEVAKRAEEMSSPFAKELATHLAAQKLTGEMTLENTQAIMAKLNTLEASLVDSESVRKEDDQQSALNPPAKANTQQTLLKVATPGDFSRVASDGTRLKWDVEGNWNPTILETSKHLAEHGINTNGMTHQEMSDIHASIHDGQPVAMRSKPTVMINRGSNCPNGRCPVPQRRGLFGGLFR